MRIRFEWDEVKAVANFRKHGVSFEDATEVFEDPNAIFRQDRVVDGEQRWQVIGTVDAQELLLVAHTTRDADDSAGSIEMIRIISARHADRKERRQYGKDR
jgi:uncharacterized DUF497 family protein